MYVISAARQIELEAYTAHLLLFPVHAYYFRSAANNSLWVVYALMVKQVIHWEGTVRPCMKKYTYTYTYLVSSPCQLFDHTFSHQLWKAWSEHMLY